MNEFLNSDFSATFQKEKQRQIEKTVDDLARKIIEKKVLKQEVEIPEDYRGKAKWKKTDGSAEEVKVLGTEGEMEDSQGKMVSFVKVETDRGEKKILKERLFIENPERETNAAAILRETLNFESVKQMDNIINGYFAGDKGITQRQADRAIDAKGILASAIEQAMFLTGESTLMTISIESGIIPDNWKEIKNMAEALLFQENARTIMGEKKWEEGKINVNTKNSFINTEEIAKIDRLRDAVERAPNGIAKKRSKEVLYNALDKAYTGLIENGDPSDLNSLALEACYTSEMGRLYEELNPPKAEEKTAVDQLIQAVTELKETVVKKQPDNKPRQANYEDDFTPEREKKITMEFVYTLLDQIENSGHSSSDITYNSNRARLLDEVVTGQRQIIDIPSGKTLESISEEISERKLLNDFFLEIHGVYDIQGINRILVSFHKGDREHTMDQNFIKFFLKDGAGGLPVAEAWDLRQDAYFDYFDVDENRKKKGMLVDIANKYPNLLTKYGISEKDFLDISVALHKNEEFGIDKDYYSNLRCETNTVRQNIVKDYMVLKIMEERGCTEAEAKKAVEMAMRLSVCTFQDSAANISLADGDQYADLVLTLFSREQDSVETGGEKPGKGKRGTGSLKTISKFRSLTPPWLALARKDGNIDNPKHFWKQLKAEEIDPFKISGKSDMVFHFGSIVEKQIMVFKDMIFKPSDPKNTSFELLEDSYSRINKAVSEAYNVGWPVLTEEFHPDQKLDVIQQKTRFWVAAGIVETATRKGSSWNWESMEGLLDWLTAPNFPDQKGRQTLSYITENQRKWIEKAYRPERILKAREWRPTMKKVTKLKI